MRVLVTGGAGFIGSHIAHSLLEEGHSVTVLDNFDPYYDVEIKEHNVELCRETGGNRFELVRGSVTDLEKVEELVSDTDIVYHEAAQAGVRTSVENPKKPNEVNIEGTLNVLLAARQEDVKRVVNASSSSVYGEVEYLPFDEEHPNNPLSPYAVSKLAAEKYCRVFNKVYGLPTVSLRYFTVYGPRMRPNMAITNFVSRCLNGEAPVIYGDGEQTRDFTYIDDVVEANLALAETDAADGEVMNIGSTGNITINELSDSILEATDVDAEKVYDEEQAGDARHTHSDVSKAEDIIGYSPEIDIREGVSKFVDWYHDNRDWYEPLVRRS